MSSEKIQNEKEMPLSDTGLCVPQEPCPSRRSFTIVTVTALFLLMGATIPTPLYGLYRIDFALSPIAITVIYAAYSIGVVPTLFFFGPLGDALGRKPLLLMAVSSGIIGTIILGFAPGFNWLIIGRLVQGIGIGAVLGNATAGLVEFEPHGNKQHASEIAGMAQLGGLALGPLTAGLMAEYLFAPTLLIYILELFLLIVAFVLLLNIGGSSSKLNSNSFRLNRPTLPPAKWSFISASIASSLVLAMSGLYFSLTPIYVQTILHTSNIALGGIIASVMVFTSVVVEKILWNRSTLRLEIGGLIALMVGLSLISLTNIYPSLIVLLTAAIMSGIGFGTTYMGAIGVINRIAPLDRRGDVTSSFYAITYAALGIPIIGLGFAAQYFNLFTAVHMFVAAIVIIAIIDIPLILLQRREK